MKTIFLICALLASPLAFTGCSILAPKSNVTWEASVYLSFADTWAVTSAAYDTYCEQAVLGKVSAEDQADIDEAWNKFRSAFRVAFIAASRDWSKFAPEDVKKLSEDLTTLIRSL